MTDAIAAAVKGSRSSQAAMSANSELGEGIGIQATHSGGRGALFHDWFPYLEGFSPAFVENVLARYMPDAEHVLEPFAGVGTTPITLAQLGISSTYCEVNPVLQHLITAKCSSLFKSSGKYLEDDCIRTLDLVENISDIEPDNRLLESYSACFGASEYFDESALDAILRLKTIERAAPKRFRDIVSIAAYTSLLPGSRLTRAGDVRFKTTKELQKGTPNVVDLFSAKLKLIVRDIQNSPRASGNTHMKFVCSDAKQLAGTMPPVLADGVITSPPYLNGTNYFRNTRLELWYCENIRVQHDLRGYRNIAITSGINDVSRNTSISILDEVSSHHKEISKVAYDQRIPRMISAYFSDMKQVLVGLQSSVRKGGAICIDIGDSIYSGVHIPTHSILSKVAESTGMHQIDEVVLRKRKSNNGAGLSQTLLVFSNG